MDKKKKKKIILVTEFGYKNNIMGLRIERILIIFLTFELKVSMRRYKICCTKLILEVTKGLWD